MEKQEGKIVRILSKDIPGEKSIYAGLAKIKGISWSFSNALCKKMNISKDKKIEELSKEDIKKITEFVKNPPVPDFLVNRRKDLDSGENKHFIGEDLNLRKDFDIKRLKKIKSYKGIRHLGGRPVRGQRTRANFRRERRKKGAIGVSKKGAKRV
jgi:small subunit ribosomal protein S13